ncbi:SDR family NAD(P)-dependent oxidoreductase [Pseudomonas sp. NPDC089534]|uniref:SDR family NAD(P)-dependent oxidoreductase n=1 Tax=Pseudomonas sp. NPDC089534 TaxID=3364468 RepID=UPI00382E7820
MSRLAGKVAIITGAGSGSGMGAAISRLFARQGACVVVTDVKGREDALSELSAELRAEGLRALPAVLDVTQEDDWHSVVERALGDYGRVDILVNNAGVLGQQGGLDAIERDDLARLMNVNVNSQFLGIKALTAAFGKQGAGTVVNIGSIGSMVAFPNVNPGYAASKGASRMLSKAIAVDFAHKGIRVNSVLPGFIATPMATDFTQDEVLMQTLAAAIPMGRPGLPEEVAQAALFLASDESAYITAAEIVVDGGYTAV